MKNLTPRYLALLTSILVTLFTSVGAYLLFQLLGEALFYYWLFVPLFMFLVTFLLFYFALEQFIYRKIKLIYKTIHQWKASHQQTSDTTSLKGNVLKKVREEVDEWIESEKAKQSDLKQLENYRKEFMGNVSHELKTPLFNIQGYLETLLDGGIEDKGINRYYLQKAAESTERLSSIVNDLETITRLEPGAIELETEKFDIRNLTQEVFDALDRHGRKKDITLAFKEGCDQAFIVEADKERIRQVLINLINNSIKYNDEGGHTKVGFYDMDEYLLIEVSDNGIGIEEEHLDRLFERFYRVDESRSRAEGGTGLGLSIVKHIIEAHGQTVNVRSTPGVGSTVGFTLQKG